MFFFRTGSYRYHCYGAPWFITTWIFRVTAHTLMCLRGFTLYQALHNVYCHPLGHENKCACRVCIIFLRSFFTSNMTIIQQLPELTVQNNVIPCTAHLLHPLLRGCGIARIVLDTRQDFPVSRFLAWNVVHLRNHAFFYFLRGEWRHEYVGAANVLSADITTYNGKQYNCLHDD